MAASHNLCYNCFAERQSGDKPCLLCGYDDKENASKYPVALKTGSILNGQYIVGRVLGQGGFGITYLAMDYQLKIKVAIKEYLPDGMATRLPDTTLVSVYVGEKQEHFSYGAERFLDEARVLAKFIGNRNIAGVKSYFTENNTSYFVMDYIEGISFKNYIKNKGGKVSYTDALRILLPVMDALSAVHREGFIHRDVTPDNIYITKNNEIKLLDFGSARYSLGDKSRSLDVILKTGYAPKEQYIRRGKQGPYTDIYSLAACFYASITGYLPPEALERMEEDEIVPISTRGIRIPDSLEDAIMKGLEVRAEDRWQSIEEFRAGINQEDVLPLAQTAESVITATQAQSNEMKITQTHGTEIPVPETAVEKLLMKKAEAVSGQITELQESTVQSESDVSLKDSKETEQPTSTTTENKFIAFIKKSKVVSLVSILASLITVTSFIVVFFAKNEDSGTEGNIASNAKVEVDSGEDEAESLPSDNLADVINPQSEDIVLASTEGDKVTQIEESETTATETTETDQTTVDQAAADQEVTDKEATDQAAADKAAADKAAADKAAADKAAADKAAADKATADKAAADKAAADKAAADKAAADKAAADKAAADKAATDKAAADKVGNTVGNIVNGGELAEQDGWIYYKNLNDGKLYKARSDGDEATMLSDDVCLYINVVDKWVYYWNFGDGGLYKIRTDGTKRTKLSEDEGWYINVVDGWMYYGIFPITGSTGIYKIRTDGTERTKLSDDECSHLNVVDDWIYYRNGSDSEKIYKIRTDGTERTKLSDDAYGFINVVDGWIYYMYGLYAKNGDDKLYKMRTDGTEQTKLSDDECSSVNVADGWVYYVNSSDDGKLYKVRIDGTKRTKVSDYHFSDLHIADGGVYYNKDGKYYKLHTDGTE